MTQRMLHELESPITLYLYSLRDSFGLRNKKECSMTYRQSETYSHKILQKPTYKKLIVLSGKLAVVIVYRDITRVFS